MSAAADAALRRRKPKAKPAPEPLPPLPLDMLPVPAANMARELAKSMSVHPDVATLACLGAMAACTTGRFLFHIDSDWEVGANAYLVGLKGSGGKKSPTMKQVYRPLRNYQKELFAAWKMSDKDHRGPSPRIVTRGNATPEALGIHWSTTGGIAAIADSEGDWWDVLSGRYSDNPSWGELLSGWDGDEYEVLRVSRGSIFLPSAWLSLCTLIQPGALDALATPKAVSRGVLGRILLVAPPEVPEVVRTPSVSDATLAQWDKFLSLCAASFWPLREPMRIRLDGGARELLYEVQEHYIAERTKSLAHMPEWAKKAAGHAVSLAAILGRCERVSSGWAEPMDAEELQVGVEFMEVFAAHTAAFPTTSNPALDGARLVAPWVAKQAGEWGRRDLWRAHRYGASGFPTAEDAQPAIDYLLDLEAIIPVGEAEPGAVARFGHQKYARYLLVSPDLLP